MSKLNWLTFLVFYVIHDERNEAWPDQTLKPNLRSTPAPFLTPYLKSRKK